MGEQIVIEDAKKFLNEYAYALIYNISSIFIGKTADITNMNFAEVREAFFFDEKGQIHLYEEDGTIKAIRFQENMDALDSRFVEYSYSLAKNSNQKVSIREYLDTDEDGQTFVKYTRLTNLV